MLVFLYSFYANAQEGIGLVQPGNSAERFPVFPDCVNLQSKALETCFYNQVQDFIFQNFEIPEHLAQSNFQGSVKVLFEVDGDGVFKVIYVDAIDQELIKETGRVFGKFPKIQPSTYNGNPTYNKFTMTIAIPLKSRDEVAAETLAKAEFLPSSNKKLTELDSIVYKKFNNPEFESHLNVPFHIVIMRSLMRR